MPRKDYAADGIVIHWDSDLCIHSANCLRALPSVFDTSARPWVQPGDTPVDDLAAAVDTCPSRALSYTRSDGGPAGPGAQRPGEPGDADPSDAFTIHVKPSGPLAVTGPVRVLSTDGDVLASGDRVFLCRCGGSGRKPLCDGTHKRVGFEG